MRRATALVLWSQYDRPRSRCYCTRSALDLRSHECTATALRLRSPYCDHERPYCERGCSKSP